MVQAQKQTHRSMGQNREPRNKHTLIQLIYDKGGKKIQWGKNKTSFINGVGKTGQAKATCKRIKLNYFFTHT